MPVLVPSDNTNNLHLNPAAAHPPGKRFAHSKRINSSCKNGHEYVPDSRPAANRKHSYKPLTCAYADLDLANGMLRRRIPLDHGKQYAN